MPLIDSGRPITNQLRTAVLLAGLVAAMAMPAQSQTLPSVGDISLEQAMAGQPVSEFAPIVDRSRSTRPVGSRSAIVQVGERNAATTIARTSAGAQLGVLQRGRRNRSIGSVTNSPGGGVIQAQFNVTEDLTRTTGGNDNRATAVISNSPGSAIAQIQAGWNNQSAVAIEGGRDNRVSALQLGNDLVGRVDLVDSTETSVVFTQVGEDQSGAARFSGSGAPTTAGNVRGLSYTTRAGESVTASGVIQIRNAPAGTRIRVGESQ